MNRVKCKTCGNDKFNVFCTISYDDSELICTKCGKDPEYEPEDDKAWRREQAMEEGMLHGVDAYNEAMGWDIRNPEEDY